MSNEDVCNQNSNNKIMNNNLLCQSLENMENSDCFNDLKNDFIAPVSYSTVTVHYPKTKVFKVGQKRKASTSKKLEHSSGFKLRTVLQESHKVRIYGACFNPFLKDKNIFATCGDRYITVYECIDSESDSDCKHGLRPLVSYRDTQENFYCCAWSFDSKGNPLLAAGGKLGVIRVIDVGTGMEKKHYSGHGGAINDMKIYPQDPNMLLSASKDQSIRLWNIKTDICVAIFGGVEGHRDQVVTIDFHLEHPIFVSGGIDHSLLIWSLRKSETDRALKLSQTFDNNKENVSFPTVHEHFPIFITRDVHQNYIDSVQWFGDLIFSKSCQSELVCWKPGTLTETLETIMNSNTNRQPNEHEINVIILKEFTLKNCNLWFIRFCVDFNNSLLAYGNQNGELFVYKLKQDNINKVCCYQLPPADCCKQLIRQTIFNRDGSILIAVSEQSFVLRYDLESKSNSNAGDVNDDTTMDTSTTSDDYDKSSDTTS